MSAACVRRGPINLKQEDRANSETTKTPQKQHVCFGECAGEDVDLDPALVNKGLD
jgi:hypothetical protein